MTLHGATFRGNKAGLPSKPCVACGLPMSWRRSWAKNWADVKCCSEACRRDGLAAERWRGPPDRPGDCGGWRLHHRAASGEVTWPESRPFGTSEGIRRCGSGRRFPGSTPRAVRRAGRPLLWTILRVRECPLFTRTRTKDQRVSVTELKAKSGTPHGLAPSQ